MTRKLTQEDIDAVISKRSYFRVGQKTTICLLTLINDFEVVGTSACVNPEEYDEEIGQMLALERAKNKVWELEGYLAQYGNAEHLLQEEVKLIEEFEEAEEVPEVATNPPEAEIPEVTDPDPVDDDEDLFDDLDDEEEDVEL